MQSVWWRIENNVHTTFVTEVINHDDLSQVFPWGSFDDAVHRPHQGGPALIMEDNDYAGGEEVFIIEPVFTPTDKENIQYYNEHYIGSDYCCGVDLMVCTCTHSIACIGDSCTLASTSILWKQVVRQETATLHTVSSV